jgi:hypothetical protein
MDVLVNVDEPRIDTVDAILATYRLRHLLGAETACAIAVGITVTLQQ